MSGAGVAEPWWLEPMVYGAVLSGRCPTVEEGTRLAMALAGLPPDDELWSRVVKRVKDRNEKLLQDNIDMCAGRKVKR